MLEHDRKIVQKSSSFHSYRVQKVASNVIIAPNEEETTIQNIVVLMIRGHRCFRFRNYHRNNQMSICFDCNDC